MNYSKRVVKREYCLWDEIGGKSEDKNQTIRHLSITDTLPAPG